MGISSANRYNFAVVFFVALGSFTYGFNASIMGTVFGLTPFFSYFNLAMTGEGKNHANNIIGATNGLFSGGGMIGCCLVAWMADAIGRRRTIQLVCMLCVVSSVVQTASVHIAMLLVGRLLSGLGSGMINVVVPLYMSEVSPADRRGQLVGAHGFLLVVGYAGAGWTGLGCYFGTKPQLQWRLCLALQTLAPLVLLLGSPLLPESPRWLMEKDKFDDAFKVLCNLYRSSGDPDDLRAEAECRVIRTQQELEGRNVSDLMDALRNPSVRRRFFMGIFVQCLAQSTGVLVINNYQILLYNSLGLSGYMPLLLYGIYTTWAAFLNWVGAQIVDRTGRIRLLTIGMVGCALMVSCEAAMVATYGGTTNRVGNSFGVVFLFCFVTFYATCVDPISYVYCSEIFPTALRARGVSFSVAGLFAMNLVYTQSAPIAFAAIGWKYYLVFIIVPLVGTPLIYFRFPETKGLSLEGIAGLFGDQVCDSVQMPDSLKKHTISRVEVAAEIE